MAKDEIDIEVNEPEVVKPVRKKKASKPSKRKDVTFYTLKKRQNIGGVWREAGEKIGLTKESYKEYKIKQIV